MDDTLAPAFAFFQSLSRICAGLRIAKHPQQSALVIVLVSGNPEKKPEFSMMFLQVQMFFKPSACPPNHFLQHISSQVSMFKIPLSFRSTGWLRMGSLYWIIILKIWFKGRIIIIPIMCIYIYKLLYIYTYIG